MRLSVTLCALFCFTTAGISVDVFSFSVLLAEVVICCDGLSHQYISEQYKRIPKYAVVNGWRPRFPSKVKKKHPLLVKLVERCWEQEPAKRPTFRDIKLHLEAIGNQQIDGDDKETVDEAAAAAGSAAADPAAAAPSAE